MKSIKSIRSIKSIKSMTCRIQKRALAALALAGFLAHAPALLAAPDQMAGYCSTTTNMGIWAFSFAYADPVMLCQRNANGLQPYAPGAVMTSNWGYYNTYTWNYVSVNCDGMWNQFNGQGNWPLQNAFNWTRSMNGQNCRFAVNY